MQISIAFLPRILESFHFSLTFLFKQRIFPYLVSLKFSLRLSNLLIFSFGLILSRNRPHLMQISIAFLPRILEFFCNVSLQIEDFPISRIVKIFVEIIQFVNFLFWINSFQKPTAFNANILESFHFSLTFLFKQRIFQYLVSLKFSLRLSNLLIFFFWINSFQKPHLIQVSIAFLSRILKS